MSSGSQSVQQFGERFVHLVNVLRQSRRRDSYLAVLALIWGRLGGRCLDSWARLPLLHHPDPSLSCNSFWVLSRRERCLDNTQKLLKKARIGVMQKDWIPQEMQRGCGIAAR